MNVYIRFDDELIVFGIMKNKMLMVVNCIIKVMIGEMLIVIVVIVVIVLVIRVIESRK